MKQADGVGWVFDVPAAAAVVTSTYVTRERLPILYVTHEYDDEEGEVIWQFHCGNDDYDPGVLQLVTLAEILRLDPSLAEVSKVPIGSAARRARAGDPWTISEETSA